jgi:anti-sigma B factor antagonist
MKIDCNKNGGILTVSLDGRLDTTTAPAFEGFLAEQYESFDALVIDCAKLAYISSAGLRVLLGAQKRTKGAMKLTNVCELVMEVFEMTGFADILSIEA